MAKIEWDDERNEILYDGMTSDEIDEELNTSDEAKLDEMGIYHPSAEQEEFQAPENQADEYEVAPLRPDYEKLSMLGTFADISKAHGAEIANALIPKDKEIRYIPKTHIGEAFRDFGRYVAPFLATELGVAGIGIGTGGIAAAPAQAAVTATQAARLAKIMANPVFRKFLRGTFSGSLSSAYVSKFHRRSDEGQFQLANLAPENWHWLDGLRGKQSDTEAQSGNKAALNDFIAGAAIGNAIEFAGMPILAKLFGKTTKQAVKETSEQVADVAATIIDNQTKSTELLNQVQRTYQKALEDNVDDVEKAVLESDFVNNGNKEQVTDILNSLKKEQELKVNEDGTFSVQVNKWQDAADVSADELKAQTNNDGIQLMDDTVRDVWRERGILADNEELITKTSKGKVNINTKAINRIKDYYRNKLDINSKIDIEFVDGKISGADANTTGINGSSSKIKILINQNADNPYAILRSELEHARDIARGEVPDQSVKHFNRYEGMNESEVSLGYVKKKADSRANKAINGAKNSSYSYHTISEKIHGEPVRVKQIKNQNGNVLAEIRYTERGNDFEIRMDNLGIEKGAARKALAYLMQEYPNKNFYWKAINEQSVKSYNHFIQEYPELADRIRFNNQTSSEVIDRGNKALYNNSNKGVIDETGSNSSQYGRRSETTLSEGNPKGAENGSNNIREDIQGISSPDRYRYEQSGRSELSNGEQHAINNTQSKQEYSKRGNTADSQKTITDTSAADTRTTHELLSEANTIQDVENVLDETVKSDKTIKNRTFAEFMQDGQIQYDKLTEKFGDNLLGIKEAIVKNDRSLLDEICARQAAAEKLISDFQQKIIDLDETEAISYIEAVNALTKWSKEIGSSLGANLVARKAVKKMQKFFSLTTMEEAGLENFAQILEAKIQSLDFTRGLNWVKKEAYKIMAEENRDFLKAIRQSSKLSDIFDRALTKELEKNPSKLNIRNAIKTTTQIAQIRAIKEGARYAANPTLFQKFMTGINKLGGFKSFYINNIFTPKTAFVNLASGHVMSFYYPMRKMFSAGLENLLSNFGLGIGKEAADRTFKEGLYTLDAWLQGFHESLSIAAKTFKEGEGTLVNLGTTKPSGNDNLDEMFRGFHKWDDPDIVHRIQNWHSAISRFMGASDEYLSQMNYRALTRAKARLDAEEFADSLKLTGKERADFIEKTSDDYFKEAFDASGKPLDIDSYAEAREMLFQTPLSGTLFNYKTGEDVVVKNQSAFMQVGSKMQQLAADEGLAGHIMTAFCPFVRTPVNIAQFGFEHSPAILFSPAQRKLLASSTEEGAKARAQFAIGCLATVGASAWAAAGGITGAAPYDKETREALFKTGWRPYSIKIGNKYVSYAGYDPVQSILGFGADMYNLYNSYHIAPADDIGEGLERFVKSAGKALIDVTLNKVSFGQTAEQLGLIFNYLNGDITEESFWRQGAANTLTNLVPMAQVPRTIGSMVNTEKKQGLTTYERLINACFPNSMGDYKRNLWGERTDTYNFIISKADSVDDLPEDIELRRLAELGWSPSELQTTTEISHKKYNLRDYKSINNNRTIYDKILEEMSEISIDGKTLREAVRELIASDEYQSLDDILKDDDFTNKITKSSEIKRIYKLYKDKAKKNIITEYGDEYQNNDGNTMTEAYNEELQEIEDNFLNQEIENIGENIRSFS